MENSQIKFESKFKNNLNLTDHELKILFQSIKELRTNNSDIPTDQTFFNTENTKSTFDKISKLYYNL